VVRGEKVNNALFSAKIGEWVKFDCIANCNTITAPAMNNWTLDLLATPRNQPKTNNYVHLIIAGVVSDFSSCLYGSNMMAATPTKKSKKPKHTTLMVRLDQESKGYLQQAANLKKLSVSDYVRQFVVKQAKQDVAVQHDRVIRLNPEDQLRFWKALNAPPKLNKGLRKLSKIMKGLA